jgi:hypothetical protein
VHAILYEYRISGTEHPLMAQNPTSRPVRFFHHYHGKKKWPSETITKLKNNVIIILFQLYKIIKKNNK